MQIKDMMVTLPLTFIALFIGLIFLCGVFYRRVFGRKREFAMEHMEGKRGKVRIVTVTCLDGSGKK